MDVGRRAKQFAPFAALRGLDETIRNRKSFMNQKEIYLRKRKMSWI